MDSITQATLGAAVGHLCWQKQLGRKSLLIGAVLGTIPDLDIIVYPLLDEVQRLYWHRGESHSVFFMVLGAITTAWLLTRFYYRGRLTFSSACWGTFLVYSTHIIIDLFTTYGTQLLAPISRKGYALSNLFIVDPLFTLPLLSSVLYAYYGKRLWRVRVNTTMLLLATCYVAWSLTIQSIADTRFRLAAKEAGHEVQRHLTSAGAFTTFLWRHVAETADGYLLGYWSIFDSDHKAITFHSIPKRAEEAAVFRDNRGFAAIEWFSRGWWCVISSDSDSIRVVDLRFTEIPTSPHQHHQQWNWPFSWSFTLTSQNEQPLQPVVPKVGNPLPTLALFTRRIAGGKGWLNGTREAKVSAVLKPPGEGTSAGEYR